MTLSKVINLDRQRGNSLAWKDDQWSKKGSSHSWWHIKFLTLNRSLILLDLAQNQALSERAPKIITVSATNVAENLAALFLRLGQEGINKLTNQPFLELTRITAFCFSWKLESVHSEHSFGGATNTAINPLTANRFICRRVKKHDLNKTKTERSPKWTTNKNLRWN